MANRDSDKKPMFAPPPLAPRTRPARPPVGAVGYDGPACADARGEATVAPTSSLVEGADMTCATLALCRELLELVEAKLGLHQGGDEGNPPRDGSLRGAVSDAQYQSQAILTRLREVAGFIGA